MKTAKEQSLPSILALHSPPYAPSTCARTSESSASMRAAAGESAVPVVEVECGCGRERGRRRGRGRGRGRGCWRRSELNRANLQ
jgi:hypothetical protein